MSAARWSNITAQDRRRIDRYRTSYDDWNEPHNFSFNNHLIDQYEGGPDALKLLYEKSECLIGQNWLNDMVISHYMDLIVTSSPISVLSLGPQFLSHCEIVDNNERVEQLMYLSKSPFQYDAWIWPVNVGGEHWTSVALYPSHQVVLYYDSFGGGGAKCRECCLLMLEWAEMVWNSEGRNSPFPGNDWQIVQITNGPRQPNQYDCGVYCCQALYELAQGLPSRRLAEGWRFGGTDLPNLRMVMTEEIATRRLRVRF